MAASIFRKIAYRVARIIYFNDYASKIAYSLKLQGKIKVSRISVDFGLREKGLKKISGLFLSDFHFGNITSEKILFKIEKIIAESKMDFILLGGDYIFLETTLFKKMKNFIKNITAPLGKFAVVGNHDRWLLKNNLKADFEECQTKLLINEESYFNPPYDFIKIFGIDDIRYGKPEMEVSPLKKGENRIFLCHSPEGLSLAEKCRFDLALFGHTHGGQIAFNTRKPFLPFKDQYSKKFPKGFWEMKQSGYDFPFYVSSGIGCVWLPVRLNSPSEVLIIDVY